MRISPESQFILDFQGVLSTGQTKMPLGALNRPTINQSNETRDTSAAAILPKHRSHRAYLCTIMYRTRPILDIQLVIGMIGPTLAKSTGNLSEREGGQTPQQTKHDLDDLSGSQASI